MTLVADQSAVATGRVRATGAAARRARGPRRHGLARTRPVASLAYVVALALAGFVLTDPLQLVALLAVLFAALGLAGKLRASLPYLRVALYVGGFLAILNPLFSQGGLDVLWQAHLPLLQIRVTIQGVAFGVSTALRLSAVLIAFALYNLVLDPDDQLGIMSRFSFRSGLVVSLATRLVPVLSRDAERITDAQRSRGVELDRGRRRDRAAARIPLLSALLTQSLERAMDIAASMEARGYGRGGRTRWQPERRWRFADGATAAAAGLAVAALIGGLVAGAFQYDFYPLLDDPWAPLADPWWLLALAALAAPLCVEARWRR